MRSPGTPATADEVLPHANTVMGPFQAVHLAANKFTLCRQLPTERQWQRLSELWAFDENHVVLQAAYS